MALGKDIGNFSFKITSVSFGENGATVDVDGTADNFGTVLGTLTFTGEPAAPGGALSWRGQSYPDGGEAADPSVRAASNRSATTSGEPGWSSTPPMVRSLPPTASWISQRALSRGKTWSGAEHRLTM